MSSITVVVAKYNENIEWVQSLPSNVKVKVYDKSDGSIPNIGREAETYIRYILENYDSLSDFTVLLQGNPWDHMQFYSRSEFFRILETLDGISFTELTPLHKIYDEKHHQYNTKGPEGFAHFFNEPIPDQFKFSGGAQYIVPRQCILCRTREFYQSIWDMMHTMDITEVGSSIVDPWTIERLWMYIFNPNIKSKSHA